MTNVTDAAKQEAAKRAAALKAAAEAAAKSDNPGSWSTEVPTEIQSGDIS
jgi:hypothetical protein